MRIPPPPSPQECLLHPFVCAGLLECAEVKRSKGSFRAEGLQGMHGHCHTKSARPSVLAILTELRRVGTLPCLALDDIGWERESGFKYQNGLDSRIGPLGPQRPDASLPPSPREPAASIWMDWARR